VVANRHNKVTRHVLGEQGLPKYVFHPDLEDPHVTRGYTRGLEALLDEADRPRPETECQVFRAMHYFAHKAHCCHSVGRKDRAAARRWVRRRKRVVEHLVRVNLGLVYRMVRQNRFVQLDEDDLFSEGLCDLLHAVEAFDPWRGYRFSTYACNCIYRGFVRLARREQRRSSLFAPGCDRLGEIGADGVTAGQIDDHRYAERLNRILEDNSAGLSDLEQHIIDRRFLCAEASSNRDSLEEIGRRIHVSKERVRQIQVVAIRKLHNAVMSESNLC